MISVRPPGDLVRTSTRKALHLRATRAVAGAGLLLTAGCAATTSQVLMPSAVEIPALEGSLASDSTDVEALVRLGVAYREARRLADAREVLERAMARQRTHAAAAFYLGITYEDLEQFAEAREVYQWYLRIGTSRTLKARVRNRLPLLERGALRAAVRNALADERSLADTRPDPSHVAVFPFLYEGPNPDFTPLSRALAEMLATDLSQTDRIRVLERARIQVLLDEMNLAQRGMVDPATAARGGQLLGAGRIVQGRLDGEEDRVRLQAAVVDVLDVRDAPPVTEQDAMRQLFEVQKRFALAIYRSLGVELTAAERERIDRRATENLQALLQYGNGLLAEDRGDFAAAAQHFGHAAQLDPAFEGARIQAAASREMAAAVATTTADLNSLGIREMLHPLLELDAVQLLVPAIQGREPAAEVLGNEGIGRPRILEIILRRPR
jgi:TolB-like protein